ncbi:hypothetical protein F5Y14DRAFT_182574 [Nemania sp. NC0429]|nr:hypothetical protein F5Y14DRAFT_182574 [Nemania sp. NC0429]
MSRSIYMAGPWRLEYIYSLSPVQVLSIDCCVLCRYFTLRYCSFIGERRGRRCRTTYIRAYITHIYICFAVCFYMQSGLLYNSHAVYSIYGVYCGVFYTCAI